MLPVIPFICAGDAERNKKSSEQPNIPSRRIDNFQIESAANGVRMGAMKPASFDSTPAFQHFKDVMRRLIAVPKAELDAMVQKAKDASP
jgi:hypothetical protein